jgi:hypothetical protein
MQIVTQVLREEKGVNLWVTLAISRPPHYPKHDPSLSIYIGERDAFGTQRGGTHVRRA